MIQVASPSDQHERDGSASPLRESQDLRWIAAAFESAQAQRLRTGDQIRAQTRVGNRESGVGNRNGETANIEALLARIRSGSAPGPVRALDDSYRREWNEERDLLRLLTERIAHPAWPWLERVRGIGPRCLPGCSRVSRSSERRHRPRSGRTAASRPLPRRSIAARNVGTSSRWPSGVTCDRAIAFRVRANRAAAHSTPTETARGESRSHARRAERTRRTIARRRSSAT